MLTKQFKNALIKSRKDLIEKALHELFKTIYSIEYKSFLVKKIKIHKKAIHKCNF